MDVFRRVSDGWKEPIADDHYKEGDGFHAFDFDDKKILIGICGDFWHLVVQTYPEAKSKRYHLLGPY